jgi:CheY-like chemotaxis protein/tRNA A-37 threonylcarbamoyl transferase component Bud32
MAKKILLIEYEPRYLDRIRGHLAGKDFDLVVAKDGEEGLDAYRKGRPDLVLISSVLPKLRTPDVIKGMQSLGAPPPILLMMSGYKGKDKKADAERVGATSILEKPFSEDVFLTEISSALGSGAGPAAGDGGAPLLSADDIFSDVLSGMDDEPRGGTPITPGGTDPGIQKKLEQTLSGILPAPKKTSSGVVRADAPKAVEKLEKSQPIDKIPTGSQTLRVEALNVPAPPTASGTVKAPGARVESSVDKMLTDTLSGLKNAKALADKGAPAPRPAPDLGLDALKTGTSDRLKAAKPAPASDKTERLDMRGESFGAKTPSGPVPVPTPIPASVETAAPRPAPTSDSKPGVVAPPKKEERRREPSQHGAAQTGGFGRYTLLEKIAAGGMAEVFKARMRGEEGFEKIVAIKRILPHMADNDDFITMFVDEAKLAAQLTHNNLIHIYDLGKVDQYHYIAMEYVEGKDLRSILKLGSERDFALPPELALFVASKIANALDYAHRRVGMDGKELNLVHRDVSPQNILISFEGDIKLCDFGIAKAATKVSQTQTGALKGKLQYISPVLAWGKKIDRRTDIFSLGIVLFEMLTGERLFTGDTDLTILEQVRDARVVAP